MGKTTRIYNRWKGYTLADCNCKYCLYYGGKRKGEIVCLSDGCICLKEIREAEERERRERKEHGS